jgi:excisionase family DNA binding protein
MRKRKIVPTPALIDPSQLQLIDIPAAAKLLSIGRTSVYGLIKDGELQTVKVKSATRIPLVALQQWIRDNTRAS